MKDKLMGVIEVAESNNFDMINMFDNCAIAHGLKISFCNRSARGITVYYTYLNCNSAKDFSLSDLLFNHEFMRALLVDKGCNGIKHLLAMREAAQLPTDQQRIDYVHGLIKGESE